MLAAGVQASPASTSKGRLIAIDRQSRNTLLDFGHHLPIRLAL
jgi:hypothetical protein